MYNEKICQRLRAKIGQGFGWWSATLAAGWSPSWSPCCASQERCWNTWQMRSCSMSYTSFMLKRDMREEISWRRKQSLKDSPMSLKSPLSFLACCESHFWARYWPYFNFIDFRAYFGHFSLVKKDKYEKQVCSKSRETNYPIMISKIVLKSVLRRGSESTPTFCIFQLLCFSLHPNVCMNLNLGDCLG